MSHQLINHSADLKQLRDEGYDIEIKSNKYLLVKNIPYINSNREVKFGTLVSELNLAGDQTVQPNTHVAYFIGEHPCYSDGSEIVQIKHGTINQQLDQDLMVNHSFSAKPKPEDRYHDYHHKMETYAALLSGPAQLIDPAVTPKTFPAIECSEEESVFKYANTSSSRAGIDAVTRKLELERVAIIGLGGTGAYVLDLVAKTPVKEIHLFDGDELLNHNAFRSPGAPSIEDLRARYKKTDYYQRVYSQMRRNIFSYPVYIDSSNVNQLQAVNFVFICLDNGEAKQVIIEKLEEFGTPFVDVGMGIQLVDDSLIGVVRVTTSTSKHRAHVKNKDRISFSSGENNEYSRNIQIADLNSLNAALAVVKWKKLFSFYKDLENEYYSTYTIDGNSLINEDQL